MKKCNATCEHACGCLCDRTPGAAVPAGYVIGSTAVECSFTDCRVYNDGAAVPMQWRPPHDSTVAQIQCDRGPLDAWHDAQEQEAEDAAWRKQLWRDGLRDVARFAWKWGRFVLGGAIAAALIDFCSRQ